MKKILGLMRGLLEKYKNLPVPVKASVWFLACSIIQKGISFITTPIFTRIMTTEQYGLFTLYNTWINIVCIFTTLNLQYGSFNTAQLKFENDRKAYTSSVQGLVTIICGIAFALFAIFGKQFSSLMELPQVILLFMTAHIWGQFCTSIWLSNRRFDYQYKSMIALILPMSLLGQLVSLFAVINTAEKGFARVLAVVAIDVIAGICIFVYNFRKGKKFFSAKYWKYALSFNLPLIPYYLSQVVFNASDRIMISSMVGMDKAGIYGLVHNLAFLLTFVISAIRNAYSPKFFRALQSNDGKTINKTNTQLMLLLAVLLLLFLFAAPELLLLMGGRTYYEAVWIIPPLIAGLFFEFFTDFSANTLFFYERKWMLVISTIGCALINIVLNYYGILWWDYFSAAYATLISYILFWLFLDLSARHICKENDLDPNAFLCSKTQLMLGGVFLILAAGCLLLYRSNLIRYGVFLVLLIVLFIFRKKILAIIKPFLPTGK